MTQSTNFEISDPTLLPPDRRLRHLQTELTRMAERLNLVFLITEPKMPAHEFTLMTVDQTLIALPAESGAPYIQRIASVNVGTLPCPAKSYEQADPNRALNRYVFHENGTASYTYRHESHQMVHQIGDLNAGLHHLFNHLYELSVALRVETRDKTDALLNLTDAFSPKAPPA